ncbi:alpha-L-arabinofuranosidase, partial [Striga asiatica]
YSVFSFFDQWVLRTSKWVHLTVGSPGRSVYTNANSMFSMAHNFDRTSRDWPKVFFEFFLKALAEASFLIGLERNSDVVEMASNAPLFVNNNDRRYVAPVVNPLLNARTKMGIILSPHSLTSIDLLRKSNVMQPAEFYDVHASITSQVTKKNNERDSTTQAGFFETLLHHQPPDTIVKQSRYDEKDPTRVSIFRLRFVTTAIVKEMNDNGISLTLKDNQYLTTESNGPCLNLSWNENANGFGLSPGPRINPLNRQT